MTLKDFIDRRYRLRLLAYRTAARLLVRPAIAALGVPVVAVTGTNGKSTVVKLLERFLRASGYRVGACTTDGVIHDGVYINRRDEAGAGGAWRAARCPGVEALVLEAARGGLLDYGTGFRRCDVGVVTNVHEDHLGDRGVHTVERMAQVKSVVPRRTRRSGTVVLNGDDPLVRGMAGLTRAEVVHFTLAGREAAFDRCWFLRDGRLWRKGADGERPFMSLAGIPMTLGGVQRYNVANALAALAALEGVAGRIPVSWTAAADVLAAFGTDPDDNLTRNTLLEYRGAHVLLAKVKNPESAREEAGVFRALRAAGGYGRVVGILTAPGGRRADFYQGIARALGEVCDVFFVRPPAERAWRGMDPGRIVEHLVSALPGERTAADGSASLDDILDRFPGGAGPKTLFILLWASFERGFDSSELIARSRVLPLGEIMGTDVDTSRGAS